jgi:hypothetical protein
MAAQLPLLRDWVKNKGDDQILPGTMIAGHQLKAVTANSFCEDGYMKTYPPRPATHYWGSYSAGRSKGTGSFVSEPFTVQGNYLIFDLLLPKKARFSFYKLPGCELNVVEAESGVQTAVLPLLMQSMPSLFRDREAVAVPVIPGRSYRVEAADTASDNWFAFSEPADAGRLAPLLLGLTLSGKLLAIIGVMLAATGWLGLRMAPATTSSSN